MIDSTSLPSSVAEPLNDLGLSKHYNIFTFTGFIDEVTVYMEIKKRLNILESTTESALTELDSIVRLAEQIPLAHEEKEEFITRIEWLQRLYKAKTEMGSVHTKEKLKQFRILIAPVQTCPLKNQLMAQLDSLEVSVAVEATTFVAQTGLELLMENAINEAGDQFINLGKAGREYVIAEVQRQEGDQSTTAHVQALTARLEQRVLSLSEVSDRVELIAALDQLPLSVFSSLQEVKKERVVDTLIQEKGWTGLFSLERRITQISKAIDREERENYERENLIDLPDGKAAATLDLRFHSID